MSVGIQLIANSLVGLQLLRGRLQSVKSLNVNSLPLHGCHLKDAGIEMKCFFVLRKKGENII